MTEQAPGDHGQQEAGTPEPSLILNHGLSPGTQPGRAKHRKSDELQIDPGRRATPQGEPETELLSLILATLNVAHPARGRWVGELLQQHRGTRVTSPGGLPSQGW